MATITRTAEKIILMAFGEIGIGGAGDPLQSEDLMTGLEKLNDFFDAMKAYRLDVWEMRRDLWDLSANTQDYTIGPTGTWTGQRPMQILRAGFVNTYVNPTLPLETPVQILTDEQWASINLKTLTSTIVGQIWYQTKMPDAIVHVFPIITTTGKLALYVPVPIDEVSEDAAGLQTTIVCPPGYRKMFRTNLAIELAPDYGVTPSNELKLTAMNALKRAERANATPMTLSLPPGLAGRFHRKGFNILTNGY